MHPVVVYLDSNEVTDNVLSANLMIFRITDYQDFNQPQPRQLHNGYQILYVGDYMNSLTGHLHAELITPTQVLVTMPAAPYSFTNRQKHLHSILERETALLPGVGKSYTTAASKMRNKKSNMMTCQVLVDFEGTGEQLTNDVFGK